MTPSGQPCPPCDALFSSELLGTVGATHRSENAMGELIYYGELVGEVDPRPASRTVGSGGVRSTRHATIPQRGHRTRGRTR